MILDTLMWHMKYPPNPLDMDQESSVVFGNQVTDHRNLCLNEVYKCTPNDEAAITD